METIDRLVQGEETNSGDGAIVKKVPTLQSMVIQPVVPTRLPRPPTIGFEELSLLTRDEPRNEGWFIDELVFFSSQGREDGKLFDLRAKLVICQALKWIGRPSSSYTSTTLVLLALAEVDPEEPNLKPDWCKLVRERDQLKEDLLKAQDVLADAAQREEALQAEHERLQGGILLGEGCLGK
ncbi:hypothetical protein R1flu_026653 [Riccia fluitans]|uniref:Uncharacterized protein n=1 Tax=Riccia fluitans TaxID=41844 RepID=A0ABD1XH32_9MARC